MTINQGETGGHYHDPQGKYDYCADLGCPRTIPGLFDVDTIFVVKMTNGSGVKEIEVNATYVDTAWRYAVQVGVHENLGYYPVTIRIKEGQN